jgi:hypothetical protein
MSWLKEVLRGWLFPDFEERLKDLERHFVTKRNERGMAIETLADVPLKERAERKNRTKGMTWQQRKQYLEETDGGRLVNG